MHYFLKLKDNTIRHTSEWPCVARLFYGNYVAFGAEHVSFSDITAIGFFSAKITRDAMAWYGACAEVMPGSFYIEPTHKKLVDTSHATYAKEGNVVFVSMQMDKKASFLALCLARTVSEYSPSFLECYDLLKDHFTLKQIMFIASCSNQQLFNVYGTGHMAGQGLRYLSIPFLNWLDSLDFTNKGKDFTAFVKTDQSYPDVFRYSLVCPSVTMTIKDACEFLIQEKNKFNDKEKMKELQEKKQVDNVAALDDVFDLIVKDNPKARRRKKVVNPNV